MNKKDFLTKLKNKINILKDEEVEDILNEYAGYIDEKVNDGKTEEEAVKELGNFNEIANDLLEAYKLKKTNSEKNVIEKAIDWITDFVDIIISNIKGKSLTDIIKFGLMMAAIFLVILIGKLPFIIIENAGVGILREFNGKFMDFLVHVWVTIIEFSYLFVAIIAFVTIVKKEVLKEKGKTPKTISNPKAIKQVSVEPKTGFITMFFDFVIKCLVLFLKIMGCFFLIGMAGYLISVSLGFIIVLSIFIKTVKCFGLVIIFCGLISIGIAFSEIVFNFIVNHKSNFKRIFLTIIFSLLALGIGTGLTSLQIAKMTFQKVDRDSTKEVSYKMEKDLIIKDFNEKDFIIDEEVKDIKAVYKYNKNIVKIRENTSKDLFIHDYDYLVNNRKIYDDIIAGLKNDIFYYDYKDISVKVYVNQKNFDLLKKNYLDYKKSINSDYSNEFCSCNCT